MPRTPAQSLLRRPAAIISPAREKLSFRVALSALSGVLLFVCFPSLNWNVLVWVATLPLLLAVTSETKSLRAFFLGYLSGAIFLAGSCYWFVFVMERYGGMDMALAVGVLALFLLVFSVFFGAFALVEAFVAHRSKVWALAIAPFLWVAMEVARTYLITGFPWNLLGYAVSPVGLRQLASVTAVYGLSFLAVSVSALLAAWLLDPRRWQRAAGVTAGVILLFAVNLFLSSPAEIPVQPQETFLVQPDIPLDETKLGDWIPWKNSRKLQDLVSLTLKAPCEDLSTKPSMPSFELEGCESSWWHHASPALVVWPENPAPFYFGRDPVFKKAMETMAAQTGAYVVTGTVMFDAAGRPRNSAVVLDPQGRVLLVYDKIHLVPFGEYVPWWAFPSLVGKITFEAGDFIPGSEYKIAATPQGGIGVFICYESIFPQLVRRLAENGAGVLVNISDDGWFGNSAAGLQHLEMARMRAIENGRYLLRATNDGVTAIIDPRGEIVARLPRYEKRVLPGSFRFIRSRTFYTAHGDIFAWLCVAVAAAMIVASVFAAREKERT
jgi:apolipoprotein N-acyltransferase